MRNEGLNTSIENDDSKYSQWEALMNDQQPSAPAENYDATMYQSQDDYEQANHLGDNAERFLIDAAGDIAADSSVDFVYRKVSETVNSEGGSYFDALAEEFNNNPDSEAHWRAIDAYMDTAAVMEMSNYEDPNMRGVAGVKTRLELQGQLADSNPEGSSPDTNAMYSNAMNLLYDYAYDCELSDTEGRPEPDFSEYINKKIQSTETLLRGSDDAQLQLRLRSYQSLRATLDNLNSTYDKAQSVINRKTGYNLM